MSIKTRTLDYRDGDCPLQAFIAWDESADDVRPGVLVSHAWRGRSGFENDQAVALARLGYVGFALDMYGTGITGNSPEENRKLMQPLLDDRTLLQRRIRHALSELSALDTVDSHRLAAIGFCFGGLCVLDLARSGADLRGVASFHGLLRAPDHTADGEVTARVLALHGWDDPMVSPDAVLEFAREMTGLGADWQLHAYGHTTHAFTNPEANDAAHGLQYDEKATRRSRQALEYFLSEVLA